MEDAETRFAPGFSVSMLVLASTLFIGGVVLVVGYIVSRLSRSGRASDASKNAEDSEKVKFEESRESRSGSAPTGTTGGGSAASNKRAKNKKRREAQQEFTHSWMVGALKGHTAPVLDVSFSSNGKFLASCAEDCGLRPEEEVLDPGETGPYIECKVSSRKSSSSTKPSTSPSPRGKSKSPASSSTTSISSSTTSSSASSEGSSLKEDRAILSRRQRKNRTRVPRDQRQDRDDEEERANRQQQQRMRRHHHSRQQVCQNSPTRSSVSSQSSSSSARSETTGSRRNRQSHSAQKMYYNYIYTDCIGTNVACYMNRTPVTWNVNSTFMSEQRMDLKHLNEAQLVSLLQPYTLTAEQMTYLCYPFECSYYPGYAAVMDYRHHFPRHRAKVTYDLDANAREFVPSNGAISRNKTAVESEEGDSGTYSGSSVENSDLEQESASDSDKNSDIGESSCSSTDSSSSCSSSGYGYQYQERSKRHRTSESRKVVALERTCARCYKNFYVNREDCEYLHEERCVYHWGKYREGLNWSCCEGQRQSRGCTSAKMHVWTGLTAGYNGPLDGFVCTQPATIMTSNGHYGVYALDCEMCYTRQGLELTKVTVVNLDGNIVYDSFVTPDTEVIDYNTRFSGITADDLSGSTKRLVDVQNDLLSFISAETILIGHSLNNDLRVLRIIHPTVIDTSATFPHCMGFPFRVSLKSLAKMVLKKSIQETTHDSAEDARIAIDLMLKRVYDDCKNRTKPKSESRH